MTRARQTFTALRTPAYRRYFAGHVVSLLGFWIRIVVQGWLVYALTGSRAQLGGITAVSLLPFVVLSPFGGVLADRLDRRRLLMWVPLVAVLANTALGLLILSGDISIWHVYVVAAVVGAARAVEIPVRNAFVRDLVGIENLGNAIALNAAGFNLARVGGPALGAGLLALLRTLGWGIGPAFLVAALLNLGMVVALAGIRVARSNGDRPAGNPLQQIAEGLRYVRGHRRTRTLLLLLALSLVCTWTYQTLMPAFARDRLGMEESGYSLLMAVPGLGALLGALWVAGQAGSSRPRGSRRYQVFGVVWAGALSVFVLGLAEHVALALPFLVAAGFCQVAFMATANGMVQESVPDALRGRVMGLWVFTFGAGFPIGSLLMGAVSERASITAAWSGGAVLTILLSLVVLWRMPPRHVAEAELEAERAARLEAGVDRETSLTGHAG